jgi:hypothetical protein
LVLEWRFRESSKIGDTLHAMSREQPSQAEAALQGAARPAAPRWEEPGAAIPHGNPLSNSQIESWRERGFVLVDGVLPQKLIERARADATALFPKPGSPESESLSDFGSGGRLQFPASRESVNQITLHPRLLAAVAQLLDVRVSELRLTQSDLWPKYGRTTRSGGDRDNDDQRIHVDYPNHSLVHPPAWQQPEAVEIILYLSDVDECDGATALVPRTGDADPAYRYPIVDIPGVGALEWVNDRESTERYLAENAPESARFRAQHLYPRETRARYRNGTLLLYRHDTWHRGTPLRPGSVRLAQNLTFRKAASEWVSVLHSGWAWAMYRRGQPMERLISAASVEQRCVLGFPEPGHPYWTAETLAGVGARYEPLGMDMTPYERGLSPA